MRKFLKKNNIFERIPGWTEEPSAVNHTGISLFKKILEKCQEIDSAGIAEWFFGDTLKASPAKLMKEFLRKGLNESLAAAYIFAE